MTRANGLEPTKAWREVGQGVCVSQGLTSGLGILGTNSGDSCATLCMLGINAMKLSTFLTDWLQW